MCSIVITMNSNLIRTIIMDQLRDMKRLFKEENLIKRDAFENWNNATNTDLIKVIYGVRRSGKSIFSFQLLKHKKYAYLNFDDERLVGLKTQDLNTVLEAFYQIHDDFKFVLLDEIQNVQGWELFVNRLKRQGLIVIITGSSSNLLSKELGSHLTGRFIPIGIYPFSFKEFLIYKNIKFDENEIWTTRTKSLLIKNLNEYIKLGGFPEAVKYPDYSRQYLSNLYSNIISKDVIGRYNIKYIRAIKDIANYLLANYSNLVTYNKIKNRFDLKSVHTAKNYLSYLEDALLFIMPDKFSLKSSERSTSPKKVYAIDSGLINAISIPMSENIGPLMENITAIELMRSKSKDPMMELYYWRDYQQHEVDFVIRSSQKIQNLIQVSYISDSTDLDRREIRSLIKASELLRCESLNIITWDYHDQIEIKGNRINCIPLWYWLIYHNV